MCNGDDLDARPAETVHDEEWKAAQEDAPTAFEVRSTCRRLLGNPVKHALLRQLYGDVGIKQMRAVKHALDPTWKLSPGGIFERAQRK